MFTLTYESKNAGVEVFHEVKIDDTELVSWPTVLEHMLTFLFNSGFIVDGVLIPEMVEACEDIHTVSIRANEEGHQVYIEKVPLVSSDWIEWEGDIHSPVNDGVYIDVKFRGGEIVYRTPAGVNDGNPESKFLINNWTHSGNVYDIVAYRICEQ